MDKIISDTNVSLVRISIGFDNNDNNYLSFTEMIERLQTYSIITWFRGPFIGDIGHVGAFVCAVCILIIEEGYSSGNDCLRISY